MYLYTWSRSVDVISKMYCIVLLGYAGFFGHVGENMVKLASQMSVQKPQRHQSKILNRQGSNTVKTTPLTTKQPGHWYLLK